MIRVGLSLPYPALEAGVRALLSADPEITIVDDEGEAADVQIVATAASPHDAAEPPSIDDGPRGVLILGADGMDLRRLWRRSIPWGVLPLDVASDELCAAVRAISAGLVVGTARLIANSGDNASEPAPLTEREVQILGLLSRGWRTSRWPLSLGSASTPSSSTCLRSTPSWMWATEQKPFVRGYDEA